MPIAHGEGNYIADADTIARLEGEGRVIFRYVAPDGTLEPAWNVNGSTNAIAGIVNERGNVLGMMPHPENHVEAGARRHRRARAVRGAGGGAWSGRPSVIRQRDSNNHPRNWSPNTASSRTNISACSI